MLHSLSTALIALSLSAIALSLWLRDTLPDRHAMVVQMQMAPQQSPVTRAAFDVQAGGIDYRVEPRFDYVLRGLVVSRHDTSAWWDIVHRDWNDHLNVVDLCVIWGPNLRSDAYRQLRYWSEVFTCNVAGGAEAWAAFDPDALSNNHVLTADPRLARVLRSIRPGDQIEVRGQLADYGHEQGRSFWRKTSTVRTDRGNGACETLHVSEVKVLREANRFWRRLLSIAGVTLVLGLLGWAVAPHRRHARP